MAATSTLNPHALHARVQKLLGSRNELESTKALLNTLVSSDLSAATSANGAGSVVAITASSTTSLADLRRNLRTSLEQKQLALAESALAGLKQTLDRIEHLKVYVDALDTKCASIQRFLESTKRETQQVQAEASTLAAKKQRVQGELEEVKQFLGRYQLTEDEIQALYSKSLADDDMAVFFTVIERIQQVKVDCRALIASGEVSCALELLDTVGKYQEVGFERLYQWTTKKCAEVDGEPSSQLQRAIALLRDRPEFYNYCKESLTSSRRSLVVRRFIIALTRGGPNGIPRPIEMYAHDPVRYCGDMLAWVHQAIATEHEFFRVLFDGDLDYTPSPHEAANSAVAVDEAGETPADIAHSTCTSMVGRAFDGVARPLQVRVEQTLSAHHGIVIAYRLVHLLAFYHHKFDSLVADSGVAIALAACREASNRAFRQQFQLLVDSVATSAQDYSANLAATHATMDISHRLVTLLEVFQSSLLPDDEKEADLAPLFDGVLPAIEQMCDRTVQSLDAVDALVFRINNLSCVRVPLGRFHEVAKWYHSIGTEIERHVVAMSELQVKRLLDRCRVTPILLKIESLQTSGASVTSPPVGLEYPTMSSAMGDFFSTVMALVLPQFDHISQPDLRDHVRTLTATKLADAYTKIYRFVHEPSHGYAAKGTPLVLHSPEEVRTVLELD